MKQPWEDSLPPLSELGVGLSAGISVVWKAHDNSETEGTWKTASAWRLGVTDLYLTNGEGNVIDLMAQSVGADPSEVILDLEDRVSLLLAMDIFYSMVYRAKKYGVTFPGGNPMEHKGVQALFLRIHESRYITHADGQDNKDRNTLADLMGQMASAIRKAAELNRGQ